MRRILILCLLFFVRMVFAADPSPSVQAEQPTKIRTFFLASGDTTHPTPHAVYFDSTKSEMAVCANSDPRLCQSWREIALDILPYSTQLGSQRLLVITDSHNYKSCTIGVEKGKPGLQCLPLNEAELLGSKYATAKAVLLHMSTPDQYDQYQCAYKAGGGLHCSSAQRFERQGAAARLFGHFTGDPRVLQVLSLGAGTSQLCDIQGTCRTAKGLDQLAASGFIASSTRLHREADRTHLLGWSATLQTVCFSYAESDTSVSFTCDQSAGASTGPLVPFTVNGLKGRVADSVALATVLETTASGYRATTAGEWAEAHRRSSELRQLAVTSYKHSGGAMSPARFKAALYVEQQATKLLHTDCYVPCGGGSQYDFDGYYSADSFNFSDADDGIDDTYWSDLNNHDYVDYKAAESDGWNSQPRQSCLDKCNVDYTNRNEDCVFFGGLVAAGGAAITIGFTVGTIWSGAGAYGVFFGGMAATGGVAATVTQVCQGGIVSAKFSCQASCPQ